MTKTVNIHGTGGGLITEALPALETDLRSDRPKLPEDQRGIVSNLIEQIKNYRNGDAQQRKNLEPLMARQIENWKKLRGDL